MVRPGIYCSNCFRLVALGPDSGPLPEPDWIELCDWCSEHEETAPKERARPWVPSPRQCAFEACAVVFMPTLERHVFCSERCRNRAHRLSRNGRLAAS
jgi:hypothetical protein